MVGVVGEGGAEAGRAAPAGVRATLLVKGGGTEVLVAGGEHSLVQHVAHFRGVGHWEDTKQPPGSAFSTS